MPSLVASPAPRLLRGHQRRAFSMSSQILWRLSMQRKARWRTGDGNGIPRCVDWSVKAGRSGSGHRERSPRRSLNGLEFPRRCLTWNRDLHYNRPQMNCAETEDIPLYAPGRDSSGAVTLDFLGFYPPEVLRPLISRQEARFEKKGQERRVVLTASAPPLLRVRALSSAAATQALSTTYTEDLYPDSAEQLAHKKKNDIPVTVTASIVTIKKHKTDRNGKSLGFQPWNPLEGFRRRRFNPDRIRPLYWSARAAEAALRPAATT